MIRTVKFTECPETALRVHYIGGKFSRGINIPNARLGQLTMEFERDVRIASSKLKAPCRTIAEYKQKYDMSFVDTPENLDILSVSLWGMDFETFKDRKIL